ncbi:hypothetical protein CMT41_13735 [Colwellia sp. MT41]|uniref:hypothetical protein n=1 Tax=Colwellia sp. MT41 TaxID=58049 RepID=UPI0007176EEF|nr:hypothetical protein [Colwellia sp. MT41]ALO35656.1 hypothetical protein CMT41_13735 [Colwellia sp. MT41]
MAKQVYLQTEIEFYRAKDLSRENLPDNDLSTKEFRFIRLGFAAMDEREVEQGLTIVMNVLYNLAS